MKTNYVEVHITCTGKSRGRNDEEYSTFDRETKQFATIEAAKQYLKEKYGNCKRVPMYIDTAGAAEQLGWIYCFNNNDISHVPVEKWHQQDWVEIRKISSIAVV